ncbi:hypothetical protein SBA1_980057 [Candidatus Sulfotelmatobacter kueseliae]|uniref:Uncharacterized protein n=1 Tax=Candidatus Sulfotelmatobacter kueseliae TaxID=2042962 RepID=A0A2U3LDW5_9BACT|nr:hypothetical protein SBA1_980057 [Candidatus Sulfotelmatobacter kueseliae]
MPVPRITSILQDSHRNNNNEAAHNQTPKDQRKPHRSCTKTAGKQCHQARSKRPDCEPQPI